jgi:hypothetical protein
MNLILLIFHISVFFATLINYLGNISQLLCVQLVVSDGCLILDVFKLFVKSYSVDK